MTKLNIIRLKNAVFYAYHGAVLDEQNLGGRFEVDVDLYCDYSQAAREDSLKLTVNYESVYSVMKEIVQGKKYYLIEALAEQIGSGIIKDFPKIMKVIVRVRKNNPPVKGVMDAVEAEAVIEREK